MMCYIQGLIQKEKVGFDGEKGAQISILPKKIVTQGWSAIMIMKYKAIHSICFFIFLLLCLYYVTDLIKKLESCLLVTFIFDKN